MMEELSQHFIDRYMWKKTSYFLQFFDINFGMIFTVPLWYPTHAIQSGLQNFDAYFQQIEM